jgi:hypothetical protein
MPNSVFCFTNEFSTLFLSTFASFGISPQSRIAFSIDGQNFSSLYFFMIVNWSAILPSELPKSPSLEIEFDCSFLGTAEKSYVSLFTSAHLCPDSLSDIPQLVPTSFGLQ